MTILTYNSLCNFGLVNIVSVTKPVWLRTLVVVVALSSVVVALGVGVRIGVVAVVLVALLAVAVVVVVASGSGGRGSRSGGGGVDGGGLNGGGLAHDGDAEELLVALGDVELRLGAVDLVGSDRVGQVELVLLDLGLDGLEADVAGNLGRHVGLDVGVGLLDGEAATKGTSKGVVSAPDRADVSSRSCLCVKKTWLAFCPPSALEL